jgi:hypothetical protein
MRILVIALAVLALAVTPVFASQCPSLIKQVNDAVAGKTDADSTKAKKLADEAQALHASGKHTESVAKAEEAAAAAHITLKKK